MNRFPSLLPRRTNRPRLGAQEFRTAEGVRTQIKSSELTPFDYQPSGISIHPWTWSGQEGLLPIRYVIDSRLSCSSDRHHRESSMQAARAAFYQQASAERDRALDRQETILSPVQRALGPDTPIDASLANEMASIGTTPGTRPR